MTNAKQLLYAFAGLATLLALLFINHWGFSYWLNIHYFNWYLQNGTLIGIVTAFIAMVWDDMRQHTDLISIHPLAYIGAHLQLVGLPLFVFGSYMRSDKGEAPSNCVFDILVTIVFMLTLSTLLLGWLLMVVPLQYFVYLFCGAPARLINHSQRQNVARFNQSQLDVMEISDKDKTPEGWKNISIADKPVTITSLFSALFFFIAQFLLNGN